MTAVGFTWFLAALPDANAPVIYTAGLLVGALWAGVIVHMLLAFPSGRLEGAWDRALVAVAYALVVAIPLEPRCSGRSR